MKTNIRLSTSDSDIEVCAQMMANSSPWNMLFFTEKQCKRGLSLPSLTLHIAEIGGEIIGFISTNHIGMEGEPLLEYICIDSRYRSQGLGSRFIEFLEEELFPEADNIYLFVSDINPRAMSLYERLGYVCTGELHNYNLYAQTEYLYRKFRRPRQERFRKVNICEPSKELSMEVPNFLSLTEQQNEGIEDHAIDLATGYPQISLPSNLVDHVVKGTIRSIQGVNSMKDTWEKLCNSLEVIIKVPQYLHNQIRSTFSGSIALNRVFVAVRNHARIVGKNGLTAIISEPSIDLSFLLLREQGDLKIVCAGIKVTSASKKVDSLIGQIELELQLSPERQLLVILDSPSNPFGLVIPEEDLERLALVCKKSNAVLVVDHCLLLAGPHLPKILPNIFSLPVDVCDWIGIWDTGKTINIGGDKAAFIVSGSPQMKKVINDSLAIIHPNFYSSRRSIEVFSRLFESPDFQKYLGYIGSICRNNFEFMHSCLGDKWNILDSETSSFACIFKKNYTEDSNKLRKDWLKAGISVVAGHTFTSSHLYNNSPDQFLRVSLLRDPNYFQSAFKLLKESGKL